MPREVDRRVRDYEIVLVTYRSRELLEQLLPTLPTEVPMVVVDNGRGVDGIGELVRDRPRTRYLPGPGRGFGSGPTSAPGALVMTS